MIRVRWQTMFKTSMEEAIGNHPPEPAFMAGATMAVVDEPLKQSQAVPMAEGKERFSETYYRATGFRLYGPADIEAPAANGIPPAEAVHLKAAMGWIYNFIMQPHPNLGRNGAVCPYVKSSIDASIFYLCIPPMSGLFAYEDVYEVLLRLSDVFDHMAPKDGQNAALRALLVLFPNATEDMLSHPQKSKMLKTEMMRRGVTLGQFFPTGHADSLLKAKFFPVQPPLCLYTMRPFIEGDWMFIQGEREWRAVYKERFGDPGKK